MTVKTTPERDPTSQSATSVAQSSLFCPFSNSFIHPNPFLKWPIPPTKPTVAELLLDATATGWSSLRRSRPPSSPASAPSKSWRELRRCAWRGAESARTASCGAPSTWETTASFETTTSTSTRCAATPLIAAPAACSISMSNTSAPMSSSPTSLTGNVSFSIAWFNCRLEFGRFDRFAIKCIMLNWLFGLLFY